MKKLFLSLLLLMALIVGIFLHLSMVSFSLSYDNGVSELSKSIPCSVESFKLADDAMAPFLPEDSVIMPV